MKKIGIASDHAGYDLKEYIKTELPAFSWLDFGPNDSSRVDYPDYGHQLAAAVEEGSVDFGIAICGSGNGINMTVNKHQGVRGALCWTEELGALAKQHNNANVLSLPARFISEELAVAIVRAFEAASFEGGRHEGRVAKISCS